MRSEIRLEEGFINNSPCLRTSAFPALLRFVSFRVPPVIRLVSLILVDQDIVKLSGTLELCTLSFERRAENWREPEVKRAFCLKSTVFDNVEGFLTETTKSMHRLRARAKQNRHERFSIRVPTQPW